MVFLGSYDFSSFAELPKVRWVLPDSYLDVKNKDYGGNDYMFPILIYINHQRFFVQVLLIYLWTMVYFCILLLLVSIVAACLLDINIQ